jgi:hypothetical protein
MNHEQETVGPILNYLHLVYPTKPQTPSLLRNRAWQSDELNRQLLKRAPFSLPPFQPSNGKACIIPHIGMMQTAETATSDDTRQAGQIWPQSLQRGFESVTLLGRYNCVPL